MAGRVRNFTTDTKNKLLGYIENNDNGWNQVGDWFGDRWMDICSAFKGLQLQDDMSNVESYHREIIDKNNASSDSIKKIFNEVNNIEDNYAGLFRQNTESLSAYQSIVSKLQDCIGDSNFASSFNRNAWQLKMADDFNKLTQMRWEEIMNKNPKNITDAEYQRVAYVLLTTNDPKILEEVLNKCYVQNTTYPVSDKDPTNARIWSQSSKLKKIYETMQAMTLSLIYDAPNASNEKVTQLIDNKVIERAVQSSQLMLAFLKDNDVIAKSVGLKGQPIFSLKSQAGDYVVTYSSIDKNFLVVNNTVTIHLSEITDTAAYTNQNESNNYISSHFGLQQKDITDSLNSSLIKYGSGKVFDLFTDLPGIKTVKDVSEILSEPIMKAKAVGDFTKISKIGKIGPTVNLFHMRYISADINNDPSRYCFSLYPTIKDPSEQGNLSTVECLKNFNDNLFHNPKYEQCLSNSNFAKPLTMDELLNDPEKIKSINDLYDYAAKEGISVAALADSPCPSQYLPK